MSRGDKKELLPEDREELLKELKDRFEKNMNRFYDCSAESPKGRRSLCYDRKALGARKEHKPANSAIEMAAAMGIEILTEEEYRELQ